MSSYGHAAVSVVPTLRVLEICDIVYECRCPGRVEHLEVARSNKEAYTLTAFEELINLVPGVETVHVDTVWQECADDLPDTPRIQCRTVHLDAAFGPIDLIAPGPVCLWDCNDKSFDDGGAVIIVPLRGWGDEDEEASLSELQRVLRKGWWDGGVVMRFEDQPNRIVSDSFVGDVLLLLTREAVRSGMGAIRFL